MLQACEKIKQVRPDLTPLDFAGADMGLWHTFMCFAFSNDTGIVNENLIPDSTSTQYKETIDLFKTFREKGYVSDGVLGYKSADAEKLYYSGNVYHLLYSGRIPPVTNTDRINSSEIPRIFISYFK